MVPALQGLMNCGERGVLQSPHHTQNVTDMTREVSTSCCRSVKKDQQNGSREGGTDMWVDAEKASTEEKSAIRCSGKSRMGQDVVCREAAVRIESAKAC